MARGAIATSGQHGASAYHGPRQPRCRAFIAAAERVVQLSSKSLIALDFPHFPRDGPV